MGSASNSRKNKVEKKIVQEPVGTRIFFRKFFLGIIYFLNNELILLNSEISKSGYCFYRKNQNQETSK